MRSARKAKAQDGGWRSKHDEPDHPGRAPGAKSQIGLVLIFDS